MRGTMLAMRNSAHDLPDGQITFILDFYVQPFCKNKSLRRRPKSNL
jgi:hypothetical protein